MNAPEILRKNLSQQSWTHRKEVMAGLAIALAVVVGAQRAALASDVLPGLDYWATFDEGTYVDFATTPLPSDFFGPGSDPFDGIIALRGEPIDPSTSREASTIVQRLTRAVLPDPIGSSDVVSIQLVELSLASVTPIRVTFNGGMTESFFDVSVAVGGTSTGEMTIQHETEGGGIYANVWISLRPRFTFVQVEPPGNPFEFVPAEPYLLEGTGPYPWQHEPPFSPSFPDQGPDFFPMDSMPDLRLFPPTGGNPVGAHPSTPYVSCCLPDYQCLVMTVEDCIAQSGSVQPTACAGTLTACCMGNGTCMMLDPTCCDEAGGVVLVGAACSQDEACCVGNTCYDADPVCCGLIPPGGGVSQGFGSVCTPNTCVDPCGDGVCDTAAGEDQCNCPQDCGTPPPNEVPGSTCRDGINNDCDQWTDCDDPDCAAATECLPTEACCLVGGSCNDLIPGECDQQGGVSRGPGSRCLNDNTGNGVDDACEFIKWDQLPDASWAAIHCHDDQSGQITCADQWQCNGGDVTDIHWWGTYEDMGSGLLYFHLSFHDDVPADPPGQPPWCLPGQEIAGWDVFPGDPNFHEYDTGMTNTAGERIYLYHYFLPNPWHQTRGQVYWLDIEAHSVNPLVPVQWKWQESTRANPPIICPGATKSTGGAWDPLGWFNDTLWTDFAFRITSAPPTEACCLPNGSCLDLTVESCAAQSGVSRGPGSVCLNDNNGNTIDDACELVKWEQPLDPNLPGLHAHDDATGGILIVADQWVCNGGAVTDFHWWGSYEATGGQQVAGFHLSIHENSPAVPPELWCLPGNEIWSADISVGQFLEVPTGLVNNVDEPIFAYHYFLDEPFPQMNDETYWLDITARSPAQGPFVLWKWQESQRAPDPIECPAVWRQNRGAWTIFEWSQFDPPLYSDMAFVVTSDSAMNPPLPENSFGVGCQNDLECEGVSTCISGRCYKPKNRYISCEPNNAGMPVKLKVTLTNSLPHPTAVGSTWWVQAPIVTVPGSYPKPLVGPGECVAKLGPEATAAEIDWNAAGCQTLHITGCPIEPTSVYDVQCVLGGSSSAAESLPTVPRPAASKWWGDTVGQFNGTVWTAPQGVTNIDDALMAIKTWQGGQVVPPGPNPPGNVAHLSVADVDPGDLNTVLNFNDVFTIVLAFKGDPYPFGPANANGDCP